MSYGPGYGAPPGFLSQDSYPGLQIYPQPAQPVQQVGSTSAHGAEEGAQPSFEYLHTAIPGLGLGFAASGPAPTQQTESAWTNAPSNSQRTASHAEQAGASAPVKLGSPADGGSEEGEISDGEAEDLYEPPEVGNDETLAAWPYGGTNVGERVVAATGQPQAHIHAARERSGSYSPYLSPREIDREGSSASCAPQGNSPSRTSAAPNSSAKTLDSVRKQAREAILRLWPLDVRYHNYIDEGIDSTLLQALFKDLGLELPSSSLAANSRFKTGGHIQPTPVPDRGEGEKTSPNSAPAAKAMNKSEERKDRIARLLAAKGSKASAPPTKSSAVPLADNQSATMKKLSEKSKILREKMEALKKQREALAQTRIQQAASNGSTVPPQDFEVTMDDATAAVAASGGLQTSVSEAHEPAGLSGQPSPSSIPGLFLSTPKPTLQDQAGLPDSMTPRTTNLVAKESHRPFGQARESRPFLIHVSDDEDDEDDENGDAGMEIDSPGLVASPVQHSGISPHLPPRKVAALSGSSRRSASALTPARNSGNSSGGEDLDSMNKKIEAMKRKIAEAEARKAKRSRQVSPMGSQQNSSSRADSVESSSTPMEAITGRELTNGSRTPVSDSAMGATPTSMPANRTAQFEGAEFAVPASERRGRSRAASERLPLLEARRREQLLKLKTLQAQIAVIEQEIEEGRAEEERLMRDLAMPDLDHELQQFESPSTPPADAQSLADQAPEQVMMDQPEVYGVVGKGASHNDVQALIDEQPRAASVGGDAPPLEAQRGETGRYSDDDTGAVVQEVEEDTQTGEHERDVDMADASESPDDAPDNESDDYEPPVAGAARVEALASPIQSHNNIVEQASASSTNDVQRTTPVSSTAEQVLPARPDTAIVAGREVQPEAASSAPPAPRSTFVPYETPLQYFHSYRFHPGYRQSVGGGLRSLTYSNKIDARREVCPDQLAGRSCPRGDKCEYQHFETMRVAGQ
ncbi:hypothetical protein JDV02_009791 [Purpureocillium takamizusanense]|uniref:C3H1-type domain-containing protein n=1 Tax=Purpureocillium takamizusanense TaxID=2060973 RepID=A0A9Q8QRK5_9HYPO|nr:uncharacterized protein JDV02_009791 [Purpureocillium takamizusanense]UNI24011.1 hypothetical protein JDV02_009791 [Purpureocillium takamizusanense]